MKISRPLRVLHIGNVAGNAYNIVKALREKTDIEAYCYADHYRYYISQPEWEDADIGIIDCNEYVPVDWSRVDLKGFMRPDWYMEIKQEALAAIPRLSLQERVLRFAAMIQSAPLQTEERTRWLHMAENAGSLTRRQALAFVRGNFAFPYSSGVLSSGAKAWRGYLEREFARLCVPPHQPLTAADYPYEAENYFSSLFSEFDIIQTYGAWTLFQALLHCPNIPRVTFEHGTMHAFPYQNSPLGRKTMFAYKTAFANIITNADSIHNSRKMGLENSVFIPHPIDDGKFCPRPDPAFRQVLLDEYGATHIFLALARQCWAEKANDRLVHAFADFVHMAGPGPKLLMGHWGQEMDRTDRLIQELNLREHVFWLPPLPKRLLARYLNACDAVLDQFNRGAFGTTTAEALACAKPVLLYYCNEDHRWCLPEAPPLFNVRTREEIADALVRVYENPAEAREVGSKAQAWFKAHHSIDLVVKRHLEIYRKIVDSPLSIAVPAKLILEHTIMTTRITCLILCDTLTPQEEEHYLAGDAEAGFAEILDARLKAIVPDINIVLVVPSPMPRLQREAARLGWAVSEGGIISGLLRKKNISAVYKTLRSEFFWFCTLAEPFIDKDQVLKWHQGFDTGKKIASGTKIPGQNPYLPIKIFSRAFVVQRAALSRLFRKHFTKLQCTSIMVRYGISIPAPQLRPGTLRITAWNFKDFASMLSAKTFTLDNVYNLPTLEILKDRMQSSSSLHESNVELCHFEREQGAERLESFPTYTALNMTSRCSARCVFCSIQPETQPFKDAITLDDVKQMQWLRYVREFAIWGGIGESLANKEFLPIFHYVRETYPHLTMTLSTNGNLLTEEHCEAFAGNLQFFNISLNAACRETWEKLMRAKGFNNACKHFARLAKLRRAKNSPFMQLSMVITRQNIGEALEFVNLASNLGADGVTFVHYMPSTLIGKRDLAPDQSLYFDRQRSDRELDKAGKQAERLGLACITPPPFNAKAEYIQFGSRAFSEAPPCTAPWSSCYLTVDEDGRRQMIFCCSGFYYNIGYDKSAMDEEVLRRVWNHPIARYFRATVNKGTVNPICEFCTTTDRWNPESRRLYSINEKIQPYFAKIDAAYRDGEDTPVERITQEVRELFAARG
jgi:MoaA/NifB/PqqE/SkfB family radical SAM enzyme/glycosyltransferase involved in cell wall biosynthesis